MKKICLILLLSLLFGCRSYVLTEEDDGKTFRFKTGDEFVLKLPENPTTGYRWKIETEPNLQFVVAQTKDEFQTQNTKLVGAGGKRIISFRTTNRGSVKLKAFHERPWEKNENRSDPNLEVTIINE